MAYFKIRLSHKQLQIIEQSKVKIKKRLMILLADVNIAYTAKYLDLLLYKAIRQKGLQNLLLSDIALAV